MEQKCILVYDDDQEILNITKFLLAIEYKQIETRSSYENLFEDIEKVKPNLILMDLRMPIVGGEYAIELLRANDKTKHIPVVVFSASIDIKNITKRINANGMLGKPFNITQLREIVRKHIA